jgi:hypothetical protein
VFPVRYEQGFYILEEGIVCAHSSVSVVNLVTNLTTLYNDLTRGGSLEVK